MKEKKIFLYWPLVIVLSYVPAIGFHLLIRPRWFRGVDSFTGATSTELLFTIILLPVYLVITNYALAKKFGQLSEAFLLNALIILSCIFLSAHFHFKNWAESVGSYSPDSETEGVMDLERIAGIIISLIGLAIVYFQVRSNTERRVNEQELQEKLKEE